MPPKGQAPCDLHVLSAPPAFVLSQDQTLSLIIANFLPRTAVAKTRSRFGTPTRIPPDDDPRKKPTLADSTGITIIRPPKTSTPGTATPSKQHSLATSTAQRHPRPTPKGTAQRLAGCPKLTQPPKNTPTLRTPEHPKITRPTKDPAGCHELRPTKTAAHASLPSPLCPNISALHSCSATSRCAGQRRRRVTPATEGAL